MNKPVILYVDDESQNLNTFKLVFRGDYKIYTATSGDEALLLLEELTKNNEPIQLVISDHKMPNMTGAELLGKVCKKFPKVVRIILTGYSELQEVKQAIHHAQIYKCISKPWDEKELKQAIDDALSGAAS
jgi:two-component system, sensor histidine kinase and response regulator